MAKITLTWGKCPLTGYHCTVGADGQPDLRFYCTKTAGGRFKLWDGYVPPATSTPATKPLAAGRLADCKDIAQLHAVTQALADQVEHTTIENNHDTIGPTGGAGDDVLMEVPPCT